MDRKMRIMVVDDEKIVRESLYHWFERAGHEVEMAASGPVALKHWKRPPLTSFLWTSRCRTWMASRY